MVKRFLAGVLIRELSSEEEALRNADVMKKCPKCLAIGTDSSKLIGVYMVPEEDAWSLNFPGIFPKSDSELISIPNLVYPETMRLEKSDIPPCGEDCTTCSLKARYNCGGCIATRC
jgi:hypothetical protein